jgi:hypothetical protein
MNDMQKMFWILIPLYNNTWRELTGMDMNVSTATIPCSDDCACMAALVRGLDAELFLTCIVSLWSNSVPLSLLQCLYLRLLRKYSSLCSFVMSEYFYLRWCRLLWGSALFATKLSCPWKFADVDTCPIADSQHGVWVTLLIGVCGELGI